MALQLLYSAWLEKETENMLCASSENLSEEDIAYILHQTEIRIDVQQLPDDEENEELSGTLYLHLPSGRHAIVRAAYYSCEDSEQSNNTIVHAFIEEDSEALSPMLYAINNCFKSSLTREEQLYYLKNPILPSTPFPRPQFKLSQKEVRKFFSPGRLKTLACILQAAIDSYENERIIILNDNYSSLKYWFYGIHCCLPDIIINTMTYSTYTFSPIENCKLICGAPGNCIDSDKEIEAGNFVIDNTGGATCDDIESAKYAKFITALFHENIGEVLTVSEGINNIMKTYSLPVSTAAGILKLMAYDFNWFDSLYDIQYFLSKMGLISKLHQENIAQIFWNRFKKHDTKFAPSEFALPLLAYVFKVTDSEVKNEIIDSIYQNPILYGIIEAVSLKQFYSDTAEQIGFIFDYIPNEIIENNSFDLFYKKYGHDLVFMGALLCRVVDKYSLYVESYGIERVEAFCLNAYEVLLRNNGNEMILEFCQRAAELSEEFIRHVIVNGAWNYVTEIHEPNGCDESSDEELIFSIMEELIAHPVSCAELLKIYAREGRYTDSTLEQYMTLCIHYPEETAFIEEHLWQKDVFSVFLTDLSLQRFIAKEQATPEELTSFFHEYYVTGKDKNQVFDEKTDTLLKNLLPVRQIENADFFLRLITDHYKKSDVQSRCDYLIPYITEQSVEDLFDYYCNAPKIAPSIIDVLNSLSVEITPKLVSVFLAVDLYHSVNTADMSRVEATLNQIAKLDPEEDLLGTETETVDFMKKIFRFLFSCILFYATNHENPSTLLCMVVENLANRQDFIHYYLGQLRNTEPEEAHDIYPLLYPWLINTEKQVASSATSEFLRGLPIDIKKTVFPDLLILCDKDSREDLTAILAPLFDKKPKAFVRFLQKQNKKKTTE